MQSPLPRARRLLGLGGLGGFALLALSHLSWLNDIAQTVQFALTASGDSRMAIVWNGVFMQYSNTWVTIFGFLVLAWVVIKPDSNSIVVARKEVPAAQAPPTQKMPPPVKPKSLPNIVAFEPSLQEVKHGDYGVKLDDYPDASAFVLNFMNLPFDSGEEVGYAERVQAEIIFRLSDSSIYQTVHHGFWLGESYNSTNIPVNAKRGLVIFVVIEHSKRIFAIQDERENHQRYHPVGYAEIIRGNPEYLIDISLVVKERKIQPIFHYKMVMEPFEFTRI